MAMLCKPVLVRLPEVSKKPSDENVPKKTTLKLPEKVVKGSKTGAAKPAKKDRVRQGKNKGKPKR